MENNLYVIHTTGASGKLYYVSSFIVGITEPKDISIGYTDNINNALVFSYNVAGLWAELISTASKIEGIEYDKTVKEYSIACIEGV